MKESLASERKKLLQSVNRLLEGPMIFLGFVWLALLVVELVWGLSAFLEYLSLAIWIVFILDFVIRFFLAPDKLRFLKSGWLTALSLLIPAFRIFRLLRVVRVVRGVRLIKVVASLNRSMKSLGATMQRRGFRYVVLLTLVVTFGGAAGMYAIEKENPGFESYGMALWWTAMRVITSGSDFWPLTPEGRGLAFILAVFGYAIFGYVTATLASFFIGRDAEEAGAPVAGAKDLEEIRSMIASLTQTVQRIEQAQREKE